MIDMGQVKARRLALEIDGRPGIRVGDCVPFYFCPRSVMLYNLSYRETLLPGLFGQPLYRIRCCRRPPFLFPPVSPSSRRVTCRSLHALVATPRSRCA